MTLVRVALGSICLSLSLVACSSSGEAPDSGKGGAGGKTSGGASGGATNPSSGGSSVASGGSTSTSSSGGNVGSGGQQGSGGANGSGGTTSSSSGGKASSGGQQSGGGANASGGTTSSSSGGKASSGGQPSGGGANASGGASASGGSTSTTGPGKQGERYPFPQNVKYPNGFQSTKVTNDFVKSWYDNWKKTRLVTCNGNLMPGTDNSSTAKVEAQGFAMVATAYMGDKDTFDKLYAFYLTKTNSGACGLSAWETTCSGVTDSGAATDGDIDVASGLLVAHWQWPDAGYDAKLKTLLANLKKVLLDCSGKTTIYPGCSGGKPWGGCDETDISYYSPAFFRYFAKFSGDSAWSKLADDTQAIRDAAANSSTGLVPDWQSVAGRAGSGSRAGNYGFDAIRAPYKQCLDYLWNGTAAAGAWCKKISSWANGVGVSNIKDGYQLNGSASSNNHNLASVGSLTIAAMTNTQEMADAFVGESVKMKDDYWYSSYLGNLYLLAMSGNMWNPDLVGAK